MTDISTSTTEVERLISQIECHGYEALGPSVPNPRNYEVCPSGTARMLRALAAERDALRKALSNIASQLLSEDMIDGDGCIEEGYDACIRTAREALGEKP